jgi:hypothetical protein
MRMLAGELGFLLDPVVIAEIDSMPTIDAELSKAEGLLKALGIKDTKTMEFLLHEFFKNEPGSPRGGTTALEREEEAEVKVKATDERLLYNTPEEVLQLKNIITADEVVAAVKKFKDFYPDNSTTGRPAEDAVCYYTTR